MTSRNRERFTFTAHSKPTVGDTKMSVISNDHMGWLKCDGRTLNKNDFYSLWRVIGYSFGGSGDVFILPNAAGRVPGVIGTTVDANANSGSIGLGSTIGAYTHTLTIAQMPTHSHTGTTDADGAHTHTLTDPGHTHTNNTIQDALGVMTSTGSNTAQTGLDNTTGEADLYESPSAVEINSNTTGITIAGASNHTHTFTTATAGQSNAFNIVQPTIGMGNMFMYCGLANYPMAGFPYTIGTNIL